MAAAAIPLALSVGGALMQNSAKQDQLSQKRSIMNRQLERDDQATNRALDLTGQEGQRYNVDARTQALADQEQKTFDQTQSDIQGAGGGAVKTAGDAGNVSSDFLTTKAQRAVDEGTRLTSLAREAAKTRAPGMLGTTDAQSKGNLAGTLQNLWSTNNNLSRATQLDADNVEEGASGGLGALASAVGGGLAAGQSGGLMSAFGKLGKSGINFVPMQPGGGY